MTEIVRCMYGSIECHRLSLTVNTRTFLKRKGGLFKKAHELSVLCSVDVAVIIFGNNKKLYEYSSSDIGEILQRYNYVSYTQEQIDEKCTDYKCSMDSQMSTKVLRISMAKRTTMMTTTTIWPLLHLSTPKNLPYFHHTSKINQDFNI